MSRTLAAMVQKIALPGRAMTDAFPLHAFSKYGAGKEMKGPSVQGGDEKGADARGHIISRRVL